jgi:nucleoid-associated protein YgaU
MFKFGLKGIIFLMGIQSLIGKMQDEGIVTGSIKINYGVLHAKVVDLVTSDEVNGLIYELDERDIEPPREFRNEQPAENNNLRVYKHVVQHGDTLSHLGSQYGVSWKVIKRANHIYDERSLQIGQNLVIPVLQTNTV